MEEQQKNVEEKVCGMNPCVVSNKKAYLGKEACDKYLEGELCTREEPE